MGLEKIIVKEHRNRNEITRDKIFYSLVKVLINDYLKIQEEYKDYVPYEPGKEFTTHLHGALILLEPNEKEIKAYCRKKVYFDSISLDGEHFIEKLESNLEDDGARIIKNNKLILKTGVYALPQAEKKEKKEISEIINKYLAPHTKFVGERSTAALAFSIATKKYTYIISQTIQTTQKEVIVDGKKYTSIGTGKVAELGPHGLTRMVKLENGDEGVPKKHLLDKDVYIKQYNYKLNKNIQLSDEKYIQLSDEKYLTIEDIASLLEGSPHEQDFKEKIKKFFRRFNFR